MEGRISTPGCYLDAREILKRHYFAYCMDCWTSDGSENSHVPMMVRQLKLASLNLDDPQFFLNRLFHFIKKQETVLLARFRSAYAGQVDEKVFVDLERSFLNEAFYHVPKKTFERLQAEYRLVMQKRKDIDAYLREKNLGQEDDERKELEIEKRNLYGTLKTIEKRQVLEFMTNAGILPNYAFPETGVTLNARIAGTRSEDSEAPPIAKDIELVRPARQAIKELMPGSRFYTQGYKLNISGLNVVNWREESESFRFCSQCDHIMEEARAPKTPCPKCGHDSWASSANKHTFLKFQAVKSFNNEAASRLDDSSEERERQGAYRTRHFRFNPDAVHGAFALKNIPFGIEFVREVEVLETNAGIASDFIDRNRIATINGLEAPVQGFMTCRYCGFSTSDTHKQESGGKIVPKEARDYHYPYCKHREQTYQGKSDEVFEELYLYRSMQTEALKILLPVQEFDSENTVAMFRAGLEKGIRHYYRGNPQHLEIRAYVEHNPATHKMDRYLILFDTIPGGTGYLEKLFDKDVFSEVLRLAYAAIRDCACRHQGKDGCYHCIFTYANQYERGMLSRSKAEAFFHKIIKAIDSWESFPGGLSKVTNTGFIEESELEERFLRALRVYANLPEHKENGCRFEPFNQDGEIWYRFLLMGEENELEYSIQPQYRLGPSNGAKFYTIADFLVRCVYACIRGREIPREEMEGFLPIAVYLDGYQYHASKENPRFANDLKKRRGILESGQYLTWTLSWEDINQMEEGQSDILGKTRTANVKTREILGKMPKYRDDNPARNGADNNFTRLLWLLEQGTHRALNDYRRNFRCFIAGLQPQLDAHFFSAEAAARFIQTGERLPSVPVGRFGEEYFEVAIPVAGDSIEYRMTERLKDLDAKISIAITSIPEGFPKGDWELFWRVYNLLQVEEPSLLIAFSEELEPPQPEDAAEMDSLDEVLSYYDTEYHPIVRLLLERRVPFTKDGSFILEKNGAVTAEAVLGFEFARLVWGPLSEADAETFRELGYTICTPDDFNMDKIAYT